MHRSFKLDHRTRRPSKPCDRNRVASASVQKPLVRFVHAPGQLVEIDLRQNTDPELRRPAQGGAADRRRIMKRAVVPAQNKSGLGLTDEVRDCRSWTAEWAIGRWRCVRSWHHCIEVVRWTKNGRPPAPARAARLITEVLNRRDVRSDYASRRPPEMRRSCQPKRFGPGECQNNPC
jgi:hypothetical protein